MLQEFNSTISKIDHYLESVLDSSEDKALQQLVASMRYSLLSGGKRLRPLFLMLVGEAYGVVEEDLLPFAGAVEMIHTYSLIHDDLPAMDNDVERRGKPTNHVVFGEAMGILAGDALLNKAAHLLFSHLAAKEGDAHCGLKAASMLFTMSGFHGMVGGQVMDMIYTIQDYDEELLLEMIDGKTVALFKAACMIPVILAGESSAELARMEEFGSLLGRAFQIRDDILDCEEDVKIEKPTFATLKGNEEAQRLVEDHTNQALACIEGIPAFSQVFKLASLLSYRSY